MDACGDLIGIYGEKADIVKELKLIVDGIYNGQSVEEMLSNLRHEAIWTISKVLPRSLR